MTAMRDPCPYCGIPYIALSMFDQRSGEIVRDIADHDCSYWAPVDPLSAGSTDVSFIREARNSMEALARVRRQDRPRVADAHARCGICRESIGIGYLPWADHLQVCGPTAEAQG